MKKLLFLLLLYSNTVGSQVLEAEDFVVEVAVGFPTIKPRVLNTSGIFHNNFLDGNSSINKNYGTFILKGEFFMTDKIGLAGSFNYSYFYSLDKSKYEVYDGNTQQYTSHEYFYETKIHRMTMMAGLNFHFVRTERLDTYFGIHAGGKKAFGSYDTNDPQAQGNLNVLMFPVAFRVHYGMRFFFTEFIGANFEIGLGGAPLVSLGSSFKF